MTSKIATYIGFAVKARKVLYGINIISEYRKKIHLLVMCKSASDNAKKAATDFASNKGLELIELFENYSLENLANKVNCKVIAITDKNLSDAIIKNCADCFGEIVQGGQNGR